MPQSGGNVSTLQSLMFFMVTFIHVAKKVLLSAFYKIQRDKMTGPKKAPAEPERHLPKS